MNMRAAVIRPRLTVAIAMTVSSTNVSCTAVCQRRHLGMLMAAIEVLVHEGMCLGKLRRMQNRQLSPAEHGDGEQRNDQELFHDPVHAHSRPASAPFVKSGTEVTKFHLRHLSVKL